MHYLIDFALDNRATIITAAVVLIAAGLYSAQRLAIDTVPDIAPKQVIVVTRAPGLGPIDVERMLTVPVEVALNSLSGVENIRSVSRYGLAVVYLRFDDGMNLYSARNLVFSRLPQAQIPPGYAMPEMGPISTGLGEIYQFQVRGGGKSLTDLRSLLDLQIVPRLKQVQGVIDVNASGGFVKTYEVQVDAQALERFGLSITDVFDAIQRNNGAVGGASLVHNDEQDIIRGEGLIQNAADIGNVVLKTADGGLPIYVRNVAQVTVGSRVRLGGATRDGEGEIVVGTVIMLAGDNSRAVVDRVAAAIKTISTNLPPGVGIAPFYDRTDLIRRTIKTVVHNHIEGAALVILVVLVLLGSIRAGLIIALAIPLSMLAAVTAMYCAGLSGNLMSLGAINFGVIVDGPVVMIENVLRKRSQFPDQAIGEVARQAAHEVARPIVFSVIIIILVYLPLLTLQDVAGKMFRPMALTGVFAIVASLVLTLTMMPVLASITLAGRVFHGSSRVLHWLRSAYAPLLKRAEVHPIATIGCAVCLMVAAGLLGSRLGGEFIPRLEEGSIVATSYKLPSISLRASLATTTLIERALKEFPEVETVVTLTGTEIPSDPMGVEQSDSFVQLKPRGQWKTAKTRADLVDAFSKRLDERVPGVQFSYSQPIETRQQRMLQGIRSDVAIMIFGDDLDVLRQKANDVMRAVSATSGASDVRAEQIVGQPYLRVIIDRAAIARYGLNVSHVLDLVQSLGGKLVGQIAEGYDIQVRLTPQDRNDIDRIRNVHVNDGRGKSIPLAELADLRRETGPAQISREQGQRRITVEANVRGRDVASFVNEAQSRVAKQVRLPLGYTMEWGGQFRDLRQATAQLALVVPAALVLVIMLLFITFNSFRLAMLIFMNVPIAVTGGVIALGLRGLPFSISAAVGFLALAGIAMLNGIVLVSYIAQLQETGIEPRQAVVEAAMMRLGPVMMTALMASLGFVPMAMSTSAGAEMQRPLATVVIGGLITSTLLTLLVLPSVYSWFARRGSRMERRRHRLASAQ
jgi:heavy metal efflux system protein